MAASWFSIFLLNALVRRVKRRIDIRIVRWGDVWTWTALDADSKLIVSYLVGQRGPRWAKSFMEDVASRIQLTTDGLKAYVEAVEGAFGCDIDYATLIKLYGNDSFDLKYSSGECIGTQTATVMGSPDPKHISTSYVERQNLTIIDFASVFASITAPSSHTRQSRSGAMPARRTSHQSAWLSSGHLSRPSHCL